MVFDFTFYNTYKKKSPDTPRVQGDRIIQLPIFVGHGIFIDTEIRLLNIIPSIISVIFIFGLCFQKWYSLVANARGLPPQPGGL